MDIPCNITEVLPDETRIVNHTQETIINWSTPWPEEMLTLRK